MKKTFRVIRILIPSIILGIFFIWLGTKDLTESEQKEIINSFKRADYFWIILSILIAMVSHISRSIRWQYSLDAVNIKTHFWNRYLTLLVNYFTNLALPRAGEVTRCALMSRYEKQPFEKIFGTIILARVIDLMMLLLIVIGFMIFQYHVVYNFIMNQIKRKITFAHNFSIYHLLGFLLILIIAFLIAIIYLRNSKTTIAQKIKKILKGLMEGVFTLFTMKKKALYFLQTLIIWSCYILMFGITFKALPDTAHAGAATITAGFVFGTLAMILTQGGIGAYPLFVMQGLLMYKIPSTIGYALGWIIWSSQTLMVIIAGMIALMILPFYNRSLKDK